jgi:hypothetical protein
MDRMAIAAAVALALGALPAHAHEKGGDRAMGVIESVSGDRIVVKASDGHLVEFAVTAETRFVEGERTLRREDVRAGRRAVVQGKRAGERLEAVRVKLGPAPPG